MREEDTAVGEKNTLQQIQDGRQQLTRCGIFFFSVGAKLS
jgi:hypothetical protein